MKKAVIVLPTYNEEGSVKKLIEEIFIVVKSLTRWDIHILVVDSQSKDNTETIVRELQKEYQNLHILITKKEGLGKAYISGFRHALETMKPFVLFEMDADGSHQPKYIPQMLEKIESGSDFVIGSRYMKGGGIPSDWGIHRQIFSTFANLIVKFGFMKPKINDWTSGFRAMKTWVIQSELSYIISYSGYVFQIALLDRALMQKAKIGLVPIQFLERVAGKSKINAAQYIFQTLLYVFTHSSFIKFVIVGLIGFVVDFFFAYTFVSIVHLAKSVANMFSAEIAIICNFLLNNFWSFRYKKVGGGTFGYVKKFFLFNFTSLGSILIQVIGLTLALAVFGDHIIHFASVGISSWIVYKVIIILCLVIPYSYFIYNKVIWKER